MSDLVIICGIFFVSSVVLGAIIGNPVGAVFLKSFDDSLLRMILGALTILYVMNSLFNFLKIKGEIPDNYSYLFGFRSGLLTSAFAAGAPRIDFSLSKRPGQREVERLASLFMVL